VETTERIVEAYCRYIRQWATIPNVRCPGGFEIDLLAIDPKAGLRYHIETSVSISSGFAKLSGKRFNASSLKTRVGGPAQRRTVGFFVERKFGPPEVRAALREHGFDPGAYQQVIVSWGWDDQAEAQADAAGVELWDFRTLLVEIVEQFKHHSAYLTDDTLRTLQLYALAAQQLKEATPPQAPIGSRRRSPPRANPAGWNEPFASYLRTTARSDRTIYHYQNRVSTMRSAGVDLGDRQAFDAFLVKQRPSTHGQYSSARNAYLEWASHQGKSPADESGK
jgi:hypothetical protein